MIWHLHQIREAHRIYFGKFWEGKLANILYCHALLPIWPDSDLQGRRLGQRALCDWSGLQGKQPLRGVM